MGLMDMVSQMTGQDGGNAQVGGSLIQELQNRPGGLGGLLQSFQQNGQGGAVQQWGQGNTAPADPNQVEQGLNGTGIIDSISQKTGMSPAMVKTGLAVLVPVMIHHLISQGHVNEQGEQTGPPPEAGGMLSSILGRIL